MIHINQKMILTMENKPYVTVHTVTYNEEVIIKFFIDHYRNKFPNCVIKIWDNHSTDNTVKIATELGCEIYHYDSGGFFDERFKNEVQNNCWKDAETVWVVVCDCDEFIDIDQEELIKINQHENDYSLVKFDGYTLVHRGDSIDLHGMKMGFYDSGYGKAYLFKKSIIKEMNYCLGCHYAKPISSSGKNIRYTKQTYKAYHSKYLSLEYSINRRKLWASRLSDWAKQVGASFEVIASKEHLYKNNLQHLDIEYLYTEQELIQVIE
jgi:hypothetical protein